MLLSFSFSVSLSIFFFILYLFLFIFECADLQAGMVGACMYVDEYTCVDVWNFGIMWSVDDDYECVLQVCLGK